MLYFIRHGPPLLSALNRKSHSPPSYIFAMENSGFDRFVAVCVSTSICVFTPPPLLSSTNIFRFPTLLIPRESPVAPLHRRLDFLLSVRYFSTSVVPRLIGLPVSNREERGRW